MKYFSAISLIFIMFPLLAAKKEAWVDKPKTLYPESAFLVAVGSGDTLASAQSRAATALASMIKVSIKSELAIISKSSEQKKGSGSNYSESISVSERIVQKTEVQLVGITFGETCTDDTGKTYAIAYIDRKKAGITYTELITKESAQVQHLLKTAESTGSVLERYSRLSAAAQGSGKIARYLEQLLVINKAAYQTIVLPFKGIDIAQKMRDAAAAMPFSINCTGESSSKLSAALGEILTKEGYVVSQEPAVLRVACTLSFEKLTLNNNYKNGKWNLALKISTKEGSSIAELQESGRISALSESEVKNRAFTDIKKAAKTKLPQALTTYFNGLLK